jgi:hypothetical protein
MEMNILMPENLKVEFPSQGWRQILTARKEILDAYDRAREQARAHEVETFHGRVAEGAFRKWLQGFLPKRYGVAAGYVVSVGLKSTTKAPHFDVIIYDQLEAPVLWVEENPDASPQGRSLAIPVEYVCGVLEVKSSFSAESVKEAVKHLGDLSPVMKGLDHPQERYKLHLPEKFFCGFVCVELRQDKMYSEAALSAGIDGIGLRRFFGGLVLRAEGNRSEHAGRVVLTQSETPIKSTVKGGKTPLMEFGMSESVPISEKVHIGTMIRWSESEFAQFAFDLIAMLQGTYVAGRLSSFYGMGSSFHEMMAEVGATIVNTSPPRDPDQK